MKYFDFRNFFQGALVVSPIIFLEILDNPHTTTQELIGLVLLCCFVGFMAGILTPPIRWIRRQKSSPPRALVDD